MTSIHLLDRHRLASGAGRLAALTLLLALVPIIAAAAPGDRSTDGVWTDLGDAQQQALASTNRQLMPEKYHVFQIDRGALDQIIDAAPLEKNTPVRNGAVLSFPMPDGTFQRFAVVESPILSDEAQAEVGDIRTYVAQGIDDPTATLRFDVGFWGFRAYGRTSQGALWIDPWELGDRSNYIAAWKHDFPGELDPFECGFDESVVPELSGDKAIPSSGSQLHTYRMIPTLTGEYCTYFGSIAAGQNAAITTINRINAIYEVDTAIRFTIVAWVAYLDAATDPFPNGSVVTSALLDQNQAVTDGFYSSDSYDIGHILTQGGGGGLAQFGVACNDNFKARGGTGRTTPQGDPFDVDYVAHEVGHQMAASHTFNGSDGSCGGNRSAGAAYEPGSGSTIMAYAGICDAENVQLNSDPYFHVKSLEQIIAFRDGTSCQSITATGNTPPVADAGADIVLPRQTPFYINAGFTDGDGDAVTYCWEQYDLGAASPPTDPYGPLFRSSNPDANNFRYFPDLGQVLAGAGDPWEIMPTVDRSLTLRVTVRDNRAGGGGTDDDEVEITVAGDPFRVTYPNGGEAFTAGHQIDVTWDVGGSQQATVQLWLLAGGFHNLGATDNDGQETVTLPCGITSADCRIWIDAVTGVAEGVHYFDVSDASFSLTDGLPDFGVYTPAGWGDNVIASPTPTLNQTSAPLPTDLSGDTTSYLAWSRGNFGNAWGCGDFVSSLRVDEVTVADIGYHPPPGIGVQNWNAGAAISGGRHTVWQTNDPDNLLAESDETNNAYARQWVWLPQDLPSETQQLRAAPPLKFAGTEHLPDGVPLIANQDAMRTGPGGFWRAVAVSNPDPLGDYDIYMYNPSTGPEDGMAAVEFSSAAGGANTDAVVINDNLAGEVTYDAGVFNWGGTSSDYRLENRRSDAVLSVGAEFSRTVAEFQVVRMEEMYLDPAELGSVSLDLRITGTDQTVTMAVFDPDFVTGGIYNADRTANVGTDGRVVLTFDATVDGYYGVAIYRHAHEGTAPFTYDLKLWQTPADLAAVTLPGSHAPLIPRNNSDIAVGNPVPAPTQLDGDTANTMAYIHGANLGPVTSLPHDLAFLYDGVTAGELISPWFGGEIPGDPSQVYSQMTGAFTVRGGRHTAGLLYDSQNTNDEIFEDNNGYAEQWVWLPTQLGPETYVMRQTPPARDGGFDLVPDGLPLFDNVDGLRSQIFNVGPDDLGYWGAVAMLPEGPADLDLRLHDPTVAPDAGFDTILEQSAWGSSASEFVLIDFDGVHAWDNAWDAGVLQFSGDASYALQSVRSSFLNLDGLSFPSFFGPFTAAGGEVIGLFEFGTGPNGGVDFDFQIDVRNLSGGANLGVGVYVRNDASGFYRKGEFAFWADTGGPGLDESVAVTLPEDGYYALVVWKVDHNDLPLDATYDIRFIDPTTVAVPDQGALPTVSRIESVYPNPFNPQTTVLLAMRQAGRASVKVYDVQGRLVRTLADETLAAGRHELRWNGTDNAGRSVPSGVYFVRAVHPDGTDHQRMSLVK